jgi:HPt (histidine-containing phosphotransfer) domain-containing protein
MATDAQAALAAALDRMWLVHLPELQERVDILEASAQAFAAGRLSVDRQQAAQAAAHKLAGVLGTFGLTRGTVLARELEIMYSRQDDPESGSAERLATIAAELRSLIENHK